MLYSSCAVCTVRKIFINRGLNFIFNVKLNLYNRPFYIKNLILNKNSYWVILHPEIHKTFFNFIHEIFSSATFKKS